MTKKSFLDVIICVTQFTRNARREALGSHAVAASTAHREAKFACS